MLLVIVIGARISFAAERGRTSDLLDGTLIAASVLSSSLIDAYNNLIIEPLSETIFNFIYSEPEPAPISPASVREQADTFIAEPAPVVNVSAPITNIDLTTLIRRILQDEITYSSRGTQGSQGVTGPRGSQGPTGPR